MKLFDAKYVCDVAVAIDREGDRLVVTLPDDRSLTYRYCFADYSDRNATELHVIARTWQGSALLARSDAILVSDFMERLKNAALEKEVARQKDVCSQFAELLQD